MDGLHIRPVANVRRLDMVQVDGGVQPSLGRPRPTNEGPMTATEQAISKVSGAYEGLPVMEVPNAWIGDAFFERTEPTLAFYTGHRSFAP